MNFAEEHFFHRALSGDCFRHVGTLSFFGQRSHFITPENTRETKFFWCFQGV